MLSPFYYDPLSVISPPLLLLVAPFWRVRSKEIGRAYSLHRLRAAINTVSLRARIGLSMVFAMCLNNSEVRRLFVGYPTCFADEIIAIAIAF
jgi:hypothetical protein